MENLLIDYRSPFNYLKVVQIFLTVSLKSVFFQKIPYQKSNALVNKTQLWYCDICDRTIKIKSKPKHINSKTNKYKQIYGIVVKEIDIIKPDFDEVNNIIEHTTEDCRSK